MIQHEKGYTPISNEKPPDPEPGLDRARGALDEIATIVGNNSAPGEGPMRTEEAVADLLRSAREREGNITKKDQVNVMLVGVAQALNQESGDDSLSPTIRELARITPERIKTVLEIALQDGTPRVDVENLVDKLDKASGINNTNLADLIGERSPKSRSFQDMKALLAKSPREFNEKYKNRPLADEEINDLSDDLRKTLAELNPDELIGFQEYLVGKLPPGQVNRYSGNLLIDNGPTHGVETLPDSAYRSLTLEAIIDLIESGGIVRGRFTASGGYTSRGVKGPKPKTSYHTTHWVKGDGKSIRVHDGQMAIKVPLASLEEGRFMTIGDLTGVYVEDSRGEVVNLLKSR